MRKKTHYDVLGVARSCTKDEVRLAFRRRALETHPDKCNTPGARDDFCAVREAHDVLVDDTSRRMYDACLDAEGFAEDDTMMTLIMDAIAGLAARWAKAAQTHRNSPPTSPAQPPTKPWESTVRISLAVTLEEIYKRNVKCVRVKVRNVPETSTVTLYVPLAGCAEDPDVVFPGLGDFDPESGRRGDIVVRVQATPPPHVRIDDVICRNDLLVERPVTLGEYLFAESLDVELFPGTTLSVPYEMGQSTAVVRGAGLPRRDAETRGMVHVFFTLVPPRRLSDAVRDALRRAFFPDESTTIQTVDPSSESS